MRNSPSPLTRYVAQVQPAGARVGPFATSAQSWSGPAGSGFDWASSRWFGVRYYRSGRTLNNQTIFAFNNAATSGWRIILGNDRTTNVFFSGLFINTGLSYMGLNHVLVGRDAGGTNYVSINGDVGASFASPGAYTAAGASALTAVGSDRSSNNFACTQTSLLQNYVLDGVSLTPAEMGAITGDKSSLDRWHAAPLLTGQAALQWLLNWESWNGTDATFAGSGPGAITLTRAGGGGGRTVMGSFDRYVLPMKAMFGNARWQYYERGANNHDTFSYTKFTSDAADVTDGPAGLVVENYSNNLGITGNGNSGVSVNGTNLAGNNVGGAEMSVFDLLEAIDVPGIVAGAAKPFVLTESLQSLVIATGVIKPAASPQAIRVPHGSSVVFNDAFGTVFTDCHVYVSDSLLMQVMAVTDVAGVKGPAYDAVPPLQRVANPTVLVAMVAEGGDTLFNNITTAAKIAVWVDHIKRACRGTTNNHVRIQMGTNDFASDTYLLQTTLQTNLGSFLTALFAAGITGLKVQFFGTTDRTSGATPNASGWVLNDYRVSQSTAVTTFANANCTYVSAAAAVSAGNKTDGLHYNTAGQAEWSAFATANPVP